MTTTPQAALLLEAAQNALTTLDGIANANPRDKTDFETPAEWIAWAKSRARWAADVLREPIARELYAERILKQMLQEASHTQAEKKCGTCGFIGQEDPVKGCPKCGFDDMQDKLQATQEPVQAVELPDEREAFEAWAQKRLQLNIERCAPPEQGFYTWQSTMDAWMAWQARAALSATQPAQAAQSDAASEAFSAMADAVPFHNGWVKPQAAQGEPVARWITHARL